MDHCLALRLFERPAKCLVGNHPKHHGARESQWRELGIERQKKHREEKAGGENIFYHTSIPLIGPFKEPFLVGLQRVALINQTAGL